MSDLDKSLTPEEAMELEAPTDETVEATVESSQGGKDAPGISDEIPPVVKMKVNSKDIKRYYSEGSTLDIKDLIVHVRSRYPNPRQRVLLQSDLMLPTKELADIFIFVEGDTEHNPEEVRGLGRVCYCLIEVTEQLMQRSDYGLQEFIDTFCARYNISSCDLLVYGDDVEALTKVWEYMKENIDSRYSVMFPHSVVYVLKLFSNGLNLAPYAQRMSQAADRNSLSIPFLQQIIQEISKEIKDNGKVALQDFEETRSLYAKWLTLTLTHMHQLSPVYLGSYLSEYIDLRVGYPFEKLSMFERLHFLSSLPQRVGFIGEYRGFTCVFNIMKKQYPPPFFVYDVANQEIIKEGLEQFEIGKVKIIDWRKWFRGSPGYFAKQQPAAGARGILPVEMSDTDADKKLMEIFMDMTANYLDEQIFLSIRNTALIQKDGKMYIAYYKEGGGLVGTLISEYFGAEMQVIPESRFHQLIDVRIVLARNKTQDIANVSDRNNVFTQLVSALPETFKPAIPIQILMYSVLVGHAAKELSYYDRRLRCDKCIMPIITHRDSALYKGNGVFDHINILNVGRDPIAGPAISSFGSINAEFGHLEQLPVSIETFRGCQLL